MVNVFQMSRHFLKYMILLVVLASSIFVSAQTAKKREFRGAWIQCVNGQFQGLSTADMQANLTHQLNVLQAEGVNAIIFQVRPECDALYESSIEPWSKFLTGVQGMAPSPYWDPLRWMTDECHKRGMELHAWVNPYRAKTKGTTALAPNHIAVQHPEYCFQYDGLYILNPAFQECTEYTCRVVTDILTRYDVDGLHIDDYFYPYPAPGQKIPDNAQYQYYASHTAGAPLSLGDWRRENVNRFIQTLSATIKAVKPWVKFGISPFGIYRNRQSDPNGSDTRGTQNYDDLYADCLKWDSNGWCDYMVPQIYWQIGHTAADYETLIRWWSANIRRTQLYIGEDIERTVKYTDPSSPGKDQMDAKYRLHDALPNIRGTVLWYSRLAVDNLSNYGSRLQQQYWRTPALQPLMPSIDNTPPKPVKKLKNKRIKKVQQLVWTSQADETWQDKQVKYLVYRFDRKEEPDFTNPDKIVARTTECNYILPTPGKKKQKYYYYVTALDRMQNESMPERVKAKH